MIGLPELRSRVTAETEMEWANGKKNNLVSVQEKFLIFKIKEKLGVQQEENSLEQREEEGRLRITTHVRSFFSLESTDSRQSWCNYSHYQRGEAKILHCRDNLKVNWYDDIFQRLSLRAAPMWWE